jgi:hypothetical protein
VRSALHAEDVHERRHQPGERVDQPGEEQVGEQPFNIVFPDAPEPEGREAIDYAAHKAKGESIKQNDRQMLRSITTVGKEKNKFIQEDIFPRRTYGEGKKERTAGHP